MPTIETESGSLEAIPGTPPDLLYPPKGDAFAARNVFALDIDYQEEPPIDVYKRQLIKYDDGCGYR